MISFADFSEVVHGKCFGQCNGSVKYLLTDSRKQISPKDVVFFAISGEFHDGHEFIPNLLDRGFTQFVVSREPDPKWLHKASFVLVSHVIDALQEIAVWWRNQFKVPVVGITGSNGKTIVKEWVAQSIGDNMRLTRSPGSYNSQIGVPLSVWMLNPEAEMALFEAGISKPGEMEKLQKLIQPNIGIFTNIGDAHQENFASFEEKLKEKLKLFEHAHAIICRNQGDWVIATLRQLCTASQCFTWSFEHEADVNATLENGVLTAVFKRELVHIPLPFSDKASIENLMHTITLLFYLGYGADFIHEALERIKAVPMRLEQKSGKYSSTIINDSYNSDLGSLANALDFLAQQKQNANRVLILSDIFQSGYIKENLYKEVAVLVNAHKPDFLVGVGKDISHFAELFRVPSRFFQSTAEVIAHLDELPIKDSTVLLKGSRAYHFEEIDHALEAKSHRTVLEVNLNALTENLNYFKSLVKSETGIIVMVKAFSYGSGSHEIANVLQYNRVAYLAVAFADEGVDLRNRGITLPVMVMNPYQTDFENIVQYRLEPVVYDFEMLHQFGKYLDQVGEKQFPVHLKLNTGMNRSGFNADQIDEFTEAVKRYSGMAVQTLFSHLAASDEARHDAFTREQAGRFKKMCSEIENATQSSIKKHLLNSAGIERFPEFQFDFVRLGIGLYGVSVDYEDIRQVGRLKTRIAQIRQVQPGETVGYARKGKVDEPKTIATIPIGYADGFRRSLSNGKGKMWVNGKLCPVIGNVCMDMTMIDITGMKASVDDEVVIFGPELSIETVAQWLETIPYEVLTGVAARVKRIYVKE